MFYNFASFGKAASFARSFGAIIVVLGSVLYVFRHSLFPSGHVAEPQFISPSETAMAVTVITIEPRTISQRFLAKGSLVVRNEAWVTAQVSGYPIQQVLVNIGDQVTETQAVAVLDGKRLDIQIVQKAASLASAQAAVAQAEALSREAATFAKDATTLLERANSLQKKGAISQQAKDERQTTVLTSSARADAQIQSLVVARAEAVRVEAEHEELLLQREQLIIRATATGVVTECNAKIGQISSADGTPLFRIMENGEVEMEALIFETALPAIRVGQKATVIIAGNVGSLVGSVRHISPIVDPATRMGKVWISITADGLRPGNFASASIEAKARAAIVVPHAAVLTGDLGTRVQVVRNGAITFRPVVIGLNTVDGIEITTGLSSGDVVVVNAGVFLQEGRKIRPVNAATLSTMGEQ
jgi:HlyD family secretion protein